MNITVVGLGLIGGSMAKDLSSQMNINVFGVENNKSHAEKALELNLVSKVITIQEALKISDIILLAIPVDQIEKCLPNLLDSINKKGVIIDLGSTKEEICQVVANHKNRSQFVAAHPLAGTEFSGPQAAVSGLFKNKKNIICDQHLASELNIITAIKLFKSVGLTTHFMSPQEHDKHLAYVSHLSHVTSFVLGLTVLDIEKDEKQILNLAGTGFASTVRLAKSSPVTWTSIFDKNSHHLVNAIESYIVKLEDFKNAIASNNQEKMRELMEEANVIKRILN